LPYQFIIRVRRPDRDAFSIVHALALPLQYWLDDIGLFCGSPRDLIKIYQEV
jgi:hypothetical protein